MLKGIIMYILCCDSAIVILLAPSLAEGNCAVWCEDNIIWDRGSVVKHY